MTDYSKFDLVTFAILLEKAKGDRSINQYANTINISAAHISRLLRKLVKSPPSPDTISKFASGACNGVTYNDLMLAAGHIDDKTEGISTEKKQTQTIEKEKNFFKIILSDLYTRDFEWSLNKTINGPTDLMLEITNWEYDTWYILIKPFITSKTIYNIYGQIACIDLTPVTKISVAVGSENEFNLFFSNPPKSLKSNLYIMLIDLNNGNIMKEEKLC
ncbi:hypothetical protein [Clostridium estertheticum]|uniref:hypothetical protein n=1 Tax=Clostridium estertheticum TaxID=238834 RepID=UPI001CF310A4|nr:hypothetical protein [Clostridium estertheticum]MCB2358654.1 hypothetical protein [Clostridium estertheticum]